MPAYLIEVFSDSIPAEGDSLEEVINDVREQILDSRIKLMVDAERVYSDTEAEALEETGQDLEPEAGVVQWNIGREIAGLIQEATLAGAN